MKAVGYYYLQGKYGNYLGEAKFTNAVHLWTRMQFAEHEADETWQPRMANAASRAVAAGKQIVLALNMQDPRDRETSAIADVLEAMTPYWGKVIAIELADEPRWTRQVTQQFAKRVKALISAKALQARPVGVVYTGKQLATKDAHRAASLDWVGIEAYLDYVEGEQPSAAARRMVKTIAGLVAKVPPGKRVVIVGQAYSRNYTWPNIESLVAIQTPIFEAARQLENRLVALTLFSYGRLSGTREYPAVKAEHRRLLRA